MGGGLIVLKQRLANISMPSVLMTIRTRACLQLTSDPKLDPWLVLTVACRLEG